MCVAPPGEQWALEVHGRLVEVELRQEFRSSLNNVCATGKNRENTSSWSDLAFNPSLLSEIAHATCAAQMPAPQNTVIRSPFTHIM